MASRLANPGVSVQVSVTDLAASYGRIVLIADDPTTRLGLLPGFEVALESSGSQLAALTQLTK